MQDTSFLQMCFILEQVLSFNGILIHERGLIYTIANNYEVLLGFEPDPTERREICNRFPVAEGLYFFDMLNDLFLR